MPDVRHRVCSFRVFLDGQGVIWLRFPGFQGRSESTALQVFGGGREHTFATYLNLHTFTLKSKLNIEDTALCRRQSSPVSTRHSELTKIFFLVQEESSRPRSASTKICDKSVTKIRENQSKSGRMRKLGKMGALYRMHATHYF